MLPHLTLVPGGAASGKSSYAEQIVNNAGRPKVYLATAQAHDTEMADKIALHQTARGNGWVTHEIPIDVNGTLSAQSSDAVVLLDCATMWLSNVMLEGSDLAAQSDELIFALRDAPCPVVVVSNEVGGGIVPENKLARQFRNAQGHLNQALAAEADTVVVVMAGLPLALKGSLPT